MRAGSQDRTAPPVDQEGFFPSPSRVDAGSEFDKSSCGPNRVYAAVKFFLYTLLGSLLALIAQKRASLAGAK